MVGGKVNQVIAQLLILLLLRQALSLVTGNIGDVPASFLMRKVSLVGSGP